MKCRVVIQSVDDWWVGWLIDIPGVNAQERTKEELIGSLIEGARDMLAINMEEIKEEQVELIDIPEILV